MVLVLGLSPLAQAIATVQLPDIKVAGDDTSGEVTPPGVTTIGKLPLKLRETPQSVSVIDHERIEQQNLFSLDEVMQQATGVTVQPFQLLTTAYYVRGFKINSFELDGVPAMLGETAGSPQDMAVYERVEILRGSNGLLHGSGNPAATVNLVRKRPQKAFAASTTLGGLLDKLNVPSVGPGARQKLADKFGSLEGVIKADWLDMRQALPEKQAKAVREFFDNPDHAQRALAIEQQLEEFGMHWQKREKSDRRFAGGGAHLGADRLAGADEPRRGQGQARKPRRQGGRFGVGENLLCGGRAGCRFEVGQGQRTGPEGFGRRRLRGLSGSAQHHRLTTSCGAGACSRWAAKRPFEESGTIPGAK